MHSALWRKGILCTTVHRDIAQSSCYAHGVELSQDCVFSSSFLKGLSNVAVWRAFLACTVSAHCPLSIQARP